jgi:heme oxygenase
LIALATESLERRFDDAFGVVRTEQERNDATTSRIKALESDLANLGEGFAIDDDVRRERDYFESLLKQSGIDPYGLPSQP